MTTDTHSCNLYCDRPECIRRQRDELRDQRPVKEVIPLAFAQLRDLVLALRSWHYHWPDYGGPPARPTPGPLRRLYDELKHAEGFLMALGIDISAQKETKR